MIKEKNEGVLFIYDEEWFLWECPRCEYNLTIEEYEMYNFCPICGARIIKVKNDDK